MAVGASSNRPLHYVRQHWFKVVAIAVVVYVLTFHVEHDEFAAAFAGVSWLFVFLAVAANFASIMLKVASWKVIFDYIEGFHGRWRDLTSALMIGFLVNALIPARVGEVARAYVICRRQRLLNKPVSRSTVFGTIVLERVFDGAAMAAIVMIGVIEMDLPTWANRGAIVLIVISIFFASILVALEVKREKLRESADAAAAGHREHHPWQRKLSTKLYGIVARFSEGQKVLRSPERVLTVMTTTSLSWTSQLFAVYFSLHAFHAPTGEPLTGGSFYEGMVRALLLLILINVAGAMPATPGNVGIFQLATVIPLTVTFDISHSTALAFSIGLQVIEGSIGLGVGSAFLLREGLKFGQVRRESMRPE